MTRPPAATRITGTGGDLQVPGLATYTKDVDWFAVERAANGTLDPGELTGEERREAALLMRRRYSRREVSVRLGIYERLVQEWEEADA
ncbi:hypothetical protein ACH4FX_12155 [Streptomyces sp. NPDC018019]|uniref:hypothetical protein n=1 Tax=Streptomyces sp. NPDC018019 TaxID=3365030 RepID=UPI0037B58F59